MSNRTYWFIFALLQGVYLIHVVMYVLHVLHGQCAYVYILMVVIA